MNVNKLDFVGFQETNKRKVFRILFSIMSIRTLVGRLCQLYVLLVVFWLVSIVISMTCCLVK